MVVHDLAAICGLNVPEAKLDILKIVRDNWEKLAGRYSLTRRQIEEMRPAFSACYD